MSQEWLRWAWKQKVSTLGEKLVLLALADLANTAGRSRVEPESLSGFVQLPPPLVDAALAQLDRDGFVSARRWDDSGAWSVTLLDREVGL